MSVLLIFIVSKGEILVIILVFDRFINRPTFLLFLLRSSAIVSSFNLFLAMITMSSANLRLFRFFGLLKYIPLIFNRFPSQFIPEIFPQVGHRYKKDLKWIKIYQGIWLATIISKKKKCHLLMAVKKIGPPSCIS